MALHLNTTHGLLALGDAPPTAIPCAFCEAPAQVASEQDGHQLVAACAPCTERVLRHCELYRVSITREWEASA